MEALKNGGTIKINADTSEAEEKFYDLDLMYDYLTTELKMDDAEARNALGQFLKKLMILHQRYLFSLMEKHQRVEKKTLQMLLQAVKGMKK